MESSESNVSSTDNTSDRNQGLSSTKLRIKSSYEDVEITFPENPRTTSVAQLKDMIRAALAKKEAEKVSVRSDGEAGLQHRYLRLICKGRLLSPDESFLSEFRVADNDVVHAVLGAASSMQKATQKQSPASHRRVQRQYEEHATGTFHHLLQQHQRRRRQRPNLGIGTVVGPGGRVTRVDNNQNGSDSSDDEGDDPERGLIRERRGFDRLRGAGLNRQEIIAIRSYFNRHVDRFIQQQQQQQQQQAGNNSAAPSTLHLDEPDLSRRRLLVEEEWMNAQGAASEFRLNLNQSTLLRIANLSSNSTGTRGGSTVSLRERAGGDRDFIWGFCLGFFVGVISLVWVWMPTIPHKQKLGILTGICFQLILETSSKDPEEEQIFEGIGN